MYSVVTIGKFDGIHKGHKKILEKLVYITKNKKYTPVVIIVDYESDNYLFSKTERNKIYLKYPNFKFINMKLSELKKIDAEYFIDKFLIEKYKTKNLVIGYDHKFGKNKEADIEYLKKKSKEKGFEVVEIKEQFFDKKTISTSLIKKYISKGKVKEANDMLGYKYFIFSKIISGNKIGRKLGYPTINNFVDKKKTILKKGVYITETIIDNNKYNSVTNIGTKPTINNKEEISIETHILNYNQLVYGQFAQINFLNRLRDEKKFNDLKELSETIKNDIKKAKKYFYS